MAKKVKSVQSAQEARPLRIAAYLRVSTDEQAESGLGLGAQEEKVRAMCVVKGWEAPTFYIDAGVTGTIDIADRPNGVQLIEDIEAGLIDAVIVAALDRIGRRAIFILNFIDRIRDRVQLVSCKESIDTATPAGRFMVTILAGLAELERDTISERTIAALEQRGRTVGIKAGLSPYGYRYEGKEVLVVPEQAEVVKLVFDCRRKGLSYRKIADCVQQATGVTIAFKTVQLILDRETAYRGGKRGESDETWPVILDNAA